MRLRAQTGRGQADMASTVPGFGATLSAAALIERIANWEQETA